MGIENKQRLQEHTFHAYTGRGGTAMSDARHTAEQNADLSRDNNKNTAPVRHLGRGVKFGLTLLSAWTALRGGTQRASAADVTEAMRPSGMKPVAAVSPDFKIPSEPGDLLSKDAVQLYFDRKNSAGSIDASRTDIPVAPKSVDVSTTNSGNPKVLALSDINPQLRRDLTNAKGTQAPDAHNANSVDRVIPGNVPGGGGEGPEYGVEEPTTLTPFVVPSLYISVVPKEVTDWLSNPQSVLPDFKGILGNQPPVVQFEATAQQYIDKAKMTDGVSAVATEQDLSQGIALSVSGMVTKKEGVTINGTHYNEGSILVLDDKGEWVGLNADGMSKLEVVVGIDASKKVESFVARFVNYHTDKTGAYWVAVGGLGRDKSSGEYRELPVVIATLMQSDEFIPVDATKASLTLVSGTPLNVVGNDGEGDLLVQLGDKEKQGKGQYAGALGYLPQTSVKQLVEMFAIQQQVPTDSTSGSSQNIELVSYTSSTTEVSPEIAKSAPQQRVVLDAVSGKYVVEKVMNVVTQNGQIVALGEKGEVLFYYDNTKEKDNAWFAQVLESSGAGKVTVKFNESALLYTGEGFTYAQKQVKSWINLSTLHPSNMAGIEFHKAADSSKLLGFPMPANSSELTLKALGFPVGYIPEVFKGNLPTDGETQFQDALIYMISKGSGLDTDTVRLNLLSGKNMQVMLPDESVWNTTNGIAVNSLGEFSIHATAKDLSTEGWPEPGVYVDKNGVLQFDLTQIQETGQNLGGGLIVALSKITIARGAKSIKWEPYPTDPEVAAIFFYELPDRTWMWPFDVAHSTGPVDPAQGLSKNYSYK